jgi:nucleoid-associated protein YgaU
MPSLSQAPAAGGSDTSGSPTAPPDFKPGTGIPIKNAGKGRVLDDDFAAGAVAPAAAGVAAVAAAGSSSAARVNEEDLVEPVPHVVARGENFWTISKLYYGEGRYYLALWKANSQIVPAPEKLYVGTTIRIPPPEKLDRSLIQPSQTTRSGPSSAAGTGAGAPLRRTSQSSPAGSPRAGTPIRRSSETELALPVDDPFIARRASRGSIEPGDSSAEPRTRTSGPRYMVRRYETLRSIARDTLGDSHRAAEILELNRDIIENPNQLVEGQYLELPEDARLGRRSR